MAESNKKSSILDTVIDIEPTGVVYNITNDIVQNFVEDYLEKMKTTGIAAVRMQVINEGMYKPDVALYVFLNQDSNGIESSANSVPPLLKGKIDKINIHVKDEFKKVLYPLVGSEDLETNRADGGECCVKLNIFRVIGMMLNVERNRHSLTISDAKKLPGNASIITVIKGASYNFNPNNQSDKYARQVGYFERKH